MGMNFGLDETREREQGIGRARRGKQACRANVKTGGVSFQNNNRTEKEVKSCGREGVNERQSAGQEAVCENNENWRGDQFVFVAVYM